MVWLAMTCNKSQAVLVIPWGRLRRLIPVPLE